MSWFGNTTTLCDELRSTSKATVENRKKAVDGFYPIIRDAIVSDLRTYASQHPTKKTTFWFRDYFAQGKSVRSQFTRAVGKLYPENPTDEELDEYGVKIVMDLNKEGLQVSYNNSSRFLTVTWDDIPKPIDEKTQ